MERAATGPACKEGHCVLRYELHVRGLSASLHSRSVPAVYHDGYNSRARKLSEAVMALF